MFDPCGVVAREPVVDLEDRACESTPIHRPDHDALLERAEQQKVFDHVGGAEHAIDSGTIQGGHHAIQQISTVAHRKRFFSGSQSTAGRMVGGDEQQAAGAADQTCGLLALSGELDDALGVVHPKVEDASDVLCRDSGRRHRSTPCIIVSTWDAVGIASAQLS